MILSIDPAATFAPLHSTTLYYTMMKIATIAALIGSASAFAPAQTGKVRLIPILLFLLLNFLWSVDDEENGFENSDGSALPW